MIDIEFHEQQCSTLIQRILSYDHANNTIVLTPAKEQTRDGITIQRLYDTVKAMVDSAEYDWSYGDYSLLIRLVNLISVMDDKQYSFEIHLRYRKGYAETVDTEYYLSSIEKVKAILKYIDDANQINYKHLNDRIAENSMIQKGCELDEIIIQQFPILAQYRHLQEEFGI